MNVHILPKLHKLAPSIIKTNTETPRNTWYDIYYMQLHQHTLWAWRCSDQVVL